MILQNIFEILKNAGFAAAGVTLAKPVDDNAWQQYKSWLKAGNNAEMTYMSNHLDIRRDPRLLLDCGAKSIISLAMGYKPVNCQYSLSEGISTYAYFEDYHDRIRRRIRQSGIGAYLGEEGRDWRICVDSAPIMERYWAVRAGLGVIGKNGSLILKTDDNSIDGNLVFLAEIVTAIELPTPTTPRDITTTCEECGLCVKACPTGAIKTDGTIDCNRCISYLTIEHRGEWKDPIHCESMNTEAAKQILFGCDICQQVCPHAKKSPESPDEELPKIMSLTPDAILDMTPEDFSKNMKGSCLKRAKLTGLLRNAKNHA